MLYSLSQFLRCFSAMSNCNEAIPGFLLLSLSSPRPPWPSKTTASIMVKLFLQQNTNFYQTKDMILTLINEVYYMYCIK